MYEVSIEPPHGDVEWMALHTEPDTLFLSSFCKRDGDPDMFISYGLVFYRI